MNLSSGYPYSLIRNGIPFDYPVLAKNRTTDVVIMGGGISGALTAFYLQKAGVACILVDSRTIGLGSTCASTSLLQYEIDKPLCKLAGLIGQKNAALAYQVSAQAIGDLEKITRQIRYPDFQYRNSIFFAEKEKDLAFLQQELDARRQIGLDVNWMDHVSLRKKYGLIAPAAIISSLAAETNAYTLTNALHQFNRKQGVEIYDRTEIVKISHGKKGVCLVTEDGYILNCKKLVYATGYESVKYIDKKIVDLSVTYATVSEQLNNEKMMWKDRDILWSTGNPYLYMRTTSDNRILAGGRDDAFTSSHKSDQQIKRKSGLLEKDFRRHFPAVPFTREFSWAGVFGSTKDGLPYIGSYPALANSFFALGFGGNGITFSLIAAQMIRDSITGKENKNAFLFAFDREINSH